VSAATASVHLQRRLAGALSGEVRFDAGSRALYSADASNYRQVPLGVVLPRTADDVAATLEVCRQEGVPLTMRGAGTSVAGNAIGTGIVVDTSAHLNRILDVDAGAMRARVEPGVVLAQLRGALAPHGLTFAPDPSTASRCTIGGMVGNNACGAHSVAWGKTSDNVDSLRLLLADGTRVDAGATTAQEWERRAGRPGTEGRLYAALGAIVEENRDVLREELGRFPRHVSGYAAHELLPEAGRNLARAFVGSEGTCGIVLEATLALVRPPRATAVVVIGFPDDVAAADIVPALLPLSPLAIEGMDRSLLAGLALQGTQAAAVRSLPDGDAWLFVEAGGDSPAEARAAASCLVAATHGRPSQVFTDPSAQRGLWALRADGAGMATRTPDGRAAYPGWEDAAVPPERLGSYLRELRALLAVHGLVGVAFGHFGEGCMHLRLDGELTTEAGVRRYRAFLEDAADLVAVHGGSLSGEHGDGRARSALLERAFSPAAITVFERFKAAWDPGGVLNPGIIVRPGAVDTAVRWLELGRPPVETALAYREDQGSIAAAVGRCVGVGKCLTRRGTPMCPSYQVTGEEQHSTRGRARLLFEMLQGEVLTDGWRSAEVHEALDLCLGCKACRSDCPVGVDMASYKAEFLHQRYRRRLRPRAHYAMGWLPLWLRLGSRVPGLATVANAVTSTGPGARLARALAGVDRRRELPRLPRRPFLRSFTSSPGNGRPGVVLWPDTFTNYLSPQVGAAAVRVLEAAGFAVRVPDGPVCCGLTWVSTGQLGRARAVARRTLATLEPLLRQGLPVVGLEPSCTAALRSDLLELLPHDPLAHQLAGLVRTLPELLEESAPGWEPPRVERPAVAQIHCHQLAVLGADPDRRLMARAGITAEHLPVGCCGLAGNFGFEVGHYEVSMAVGEQSLLPAVRAAGDSTLVIADGFSCRTQIHHGTGRRGQHLAEALAAQLDETRPPGEDRT
jgi:FAD/FMN-containing dehydrogenase/Fe-S oxidoreductase